MIWLISDINIHYGLSFKNGIPDRVVATRPVFVHFYFQIEMTVDLTDWQFLLFFRILQRRAAGVSREFHEKMLSQEQNS